MFPKKKYTDQGSPGDLAVKCVPMQGNMGLIPGPGRSHMLQSYQAGVAQLWSPSCRVQKLQLLRLCSDARKPQMLSLRVTTTEAHTPRIHAPREKWLQWEGTRYSDEQTPSKQLEKAHLQQLRTQNSQKWIHKS